MASFDELDFKLRTFMKLYRYRRYDTTPHTPLQRPYSGVSSCLSYDCRFIYSISGTLR